MRSKEDKQTNKIAEAGSPPDYDELEDRVERRTALLKQQIRQRRQAEEALQQESANVKLLQEVAVAANEAQSVEEVLQFALDKICQHTGWPLGHVYTVSPQGKLVSSGLWHSNNGEQFEFFIETTKATRFEPGEGWLGQVFSSGQPDWLTSTKDPDFLRNHRLEELGITSGFAFPVLVGSDVVAILEFFSPEMIGPDDRLLEVMSHIGTQLGRVVERERAAQALHDSERRFRAIFNQTFQLIGLLTPEGVLLEANETALRFGGLTREEVIGKPFWETYWWAISPQTQQQLQTAIDEAAAGNFVRYEADVRGAEGAIITVDFSLKPVYDDDGNVILLIPEGRDITRRKQTMKRLLKSEMLLAEAQRIAHIGSWEWDIVNDTITWSEELYRIYGLEPEEFAPSYDAFLKLVHSDDRETVDRIVRTALDAKEPFEFYHRITRQEDSQVRIVHGQGQPVLNEAGEVVRMYGTGQDVTEQKETEWALRQSEEQYRTLAGNLPDAAVLLYDQNLRVLLAEGTAKTHPFLSKPETEGQTLWELAPSEEGEEWATPYLETLAGASQEFERVFQDRDFLVRTSPVRNEDGDISAGMILAQDISRRKQNEAKLAKTARQLAALNEMGQAVAASLELDTVLDRVLESLRPLLRAEGVFILLRDKDEFVFAAANEVGVGNLQGQRVPVTGGVAGEVVHSGQSVWVSGEETAERVYRDIEKVAHYVPRAILATPLRIRDELIGVMEAVHSQADVFRQDDLALLEAAATWTSIAIENARLFGAQQQARQTAETLRAANMTMTQTLNLDTVLETLLDYLSQLIDYSSADVMLREENLLRIYALRGYAGTVDDYQARQHVLRASWYPHIEAVFNQKESVVISDTDSYPGWQPHFEGAEQVRSWLGIPLLARNKIMGLCSLGHTTPSYFTHEHRVLAEALTAQATSAVQNARLFNQVRVGQERLRKLAARVVSAQEQERQRVSRELHDEAGQALTALKISLDMMQASLPGELESLKQNVIEAANLTDETMERIRLLAHDLRPPALDTIGLNLTLEGLCRDFGQRTQLPVKYESVDLPAIPDSITISLYRFVQEALTNVSKHARASQVEVTLRYDGDLIQLSVADNGRGFNAEEVVSSRPSTGIGLIGMYERLETLDGRLEIESESGKGTRLTAYVPFREELSEE